MSVLLIRRPPCVEPIYGFADWAAGYTEGEPVEEVPAEAQETIPAEVASASEGWSYVQKGALFAVIIGGVAVYIKLSRRVRPEDLGYRKTMA